jgi:hypothetical protein
MLLACGVRCNTDTLTRTDGVHYKYRYGDQTDSDVLHGVTYSNFECICYALSYLWDATSLP